MRHETVSWRAEPPCSVSSFFRPRALAAPLFLVPSVLLGPPFPPSPFRSLALPFVYSPPRWSRRSRRSRRSASDQPSNPRTEIPRLSFVPSDFSRTSGSRISAPPASHLRPGAHRSVRWAGNAPNFRRIFGEFSAKLATRLLHSDSTRSERDRGQKMVKRLWEHRLGRATYRVKIALIFPQRIARPRGAL